MCVASGNLKAAGTAQTTISSAIGKGKADETKKMSVYFVCLVFWEPESSRHSAKTTISSAIVKSKADETKKMSVYFVCSVSGKLKASNVQTVQRIGCAEK